MMMMMFTNWTTGFRFPAEARSRKLPPGPESGVQLASYPMGAPSEWVKWSDIASHQMGDPYEWVKWSNVASHPMATPSKRVKWSDIASHQMGDPYERVKWSDGEDHDSLPSSTLCLDTGTMLCSTLLMGFSPTLEACNEHHENQQNSLEIKF